MPRLLTIQAAQNNMFSFQFALLSGYWLCFKLYL